MPASGLVAGRHCLAPRTAGAGPAAAEGPPRAAAAPGRPGLPPCASRGQGPRWRSAFRRRLSPVSSRSREQLLLLRSPFPARPGAPAPSPPPRSLARRGPVS